MYQVVMLSIAQSMLVKFLRSAQSALTIVVKGAPHAGYEQQKMSFPRLQRRISYTIVVSLS